MEGKEERRGVVTRVRALRRDRGGGRGIQRGGRAREGAAGPGSLSVPSRVRRSWPSAAEVRSGPASGESVAPAVEDFLWCARGFRGRAVPLCSGCCCLCLARNRKGKMDGRRRKGLPFSTGSEPSDSRKFVSRQLPGSASLTLRLSSSRAPAPAPASLGWALALAGPLSA